LSKDNIHIVLHEDGWAIEKEHSNRASRVVPTKEKALGIGRDMAKKQHVELVIHKKDGTIQDKDSYGNDPFPARDKKH